MGSFDDYTKEGKDPENKDTPPQPETIIVPRPPDLTPWYKKMQWAIIVPAALVSGFFNYKGIKNIEPSPAPVRQKVTAPPKTVIKWKTKYITRWRTPKTIIKWKTRTVPPQIIYRTKYVKDPAYDAKFLEIQQHYRRRDRLLQEFYTKPLAKGMKRTLTFKSQCPKPFDNVQRVYNMD